MEHTLVTDRFQNELATALISNDSAMLEAPNLLKIYNCLGISSAKHNDWVTPYSNGKVTAVDIVNWMLGEWRERLKSDATIRNLLTALNDFKYAAETGRMIFDLNPHSITPPVPQQVSNLPRLSKRPLILTNVIDAGGYGMVYKAYCPGDNKSYAVKSISVGRFVQLTKIKDGEDYYEKLLREIKTLSKVEACPNVVSYKSSWFEGQLEQRFNLLLHYPEDSNAPKLTANSHQPPLPSQDEIKTYFLIQMELCEKDLFNFVTTPGIDWTTLSFIEGTIVQGVLLGLKHLHKLDIAHRDIQPKNILLTKVDNLWVAKIGDMGLAREVVDNDRALTNQIGFPDYRSPEMWRGDTYGRKTDVFSLGLIYMMLVCKPSPGNRYYQVIDEARKGNLSTLSYIESNFDHEFTLMRKMLARSDKHRPTAEEALGLLEEEIRSR